MKTEPAPGLPGWIEKQLPAGIRRYVVPVGDKRLHVMESGSGFPVLMLHGNPTWSFLYRKIMDRLAGVPFRCIAPDLVGLGFSTKTGADAHTLPNHAGWIGKLIDALELDQLIFVGQDWGGPIGVRALADRPEKLVGLVLMNTAVIPPRQDFKPTTFHRFSNMPIISDLVFRGFGFPLNILHKVQGDPDSIRGDVARAYRYPLKRFRDNAAPLALARMVPNSVDHPSVAELAECRNFMSGFNGPAEFVWGKKDPILGRALKRMRSVLPDAPVTETEAGHFLQEEVPDEIAAAIRRVAEKV